MDFFKGNVKKCIIPDIQTYTNKKRLNNMLFKNHFVLITLHLFIILRINLYQMLFTQNNANTTPHRHQSKKKMLSFKQKTGYRNFMYIILLCLTNKLYIFMMMSV